MRRETFRRRRATTAPLYAMAVAAVTVLGCESMAEPEPEPIQDIAPAEIRWTEDWANAGDASDIRVSVRYPSRRAGIASYRLFVAKAAAGEAAADGLAALPADRYLEIPADDRVDEPVLPAGLLDTDGDAVVPGVPYRALVLTLAAMDSVEHRVAAAPDSVILALNNLVRTLTDPIEAGSGGMDVDADGRIYAADFGETLGGPPGERVYRITPAGEVSVFAEGFLGASGNDFDSQGDLFQASITADRISRVTPDGTVTDFVTEGIDGPVGIVFDPGDTLYVANCQAGTISKVTPEGDVSLFADSFLFRCPNGLTLADDGSLYAANFNDGNVLRVDPTGQVSVFATLPGGNNGHILFGNGVLYVVDRGGSRIYEVTLDGEVRALAGTGERGLRDGDALNATLSLTNDIALSPDGSVLYFNDVAQASEDDLVISPVVIRALILAGN